MTDITQDPTASLDHWLLKGAHRSPDGTEWYGQHNNEMWVAKVGPPGWRARIVSGAVLGRAGGPTLWRALEVLCGLAGWKQPADREDGPIDWDKQRPEVGDHEPEDLVALSDYGWHLDIHDDLVLCPSQDAALRMQSWWDRANAAEAERDRLAARVGLLEGAILRAAKDPRSDVDPLHGYTSCTRCGATSPEDAAGKCRASQDQSGEYTCPGTDHPLNRVWGDGGDPEDAHVVLLDDVMNYWGQRASFLEQEVDRLEAAIDDAVEAMDGDARDSGPPLTEQLRRSVDASCRQIRDEIERYEKIGGDLVEARAELEQYRERVAELEAFDPDGWREHAENIARGHCVQCDDGQHLSDGVFGPCKYCGRMCSGQQANWMPKAAAPDWRPGVPSVEDVRAHEARGGLWRYKREACVLRVEGDHVEVHRGHSVCEYEDLDDEGRGLWAPFFIGSTPAPWPVHGDSATEDSPAAWPAHWLFKLATKADFSDPERPVFCGTGNPEAWAIFRYLEGAEPRLVPYWGYSHGGSHMTGFGTAEAAAEDLCQHRGWKKPSDNDENICTVVGGGDCEGVADAG